MKSVSAILPVIAACIVSCTWNGSTNDDVHDVAALGGTWELQNILGAGVAFDSLYPAARPVLLIDTKAKTIRGNTGCNSYSGPLNVKHDNIDFSGPIAVTEMMCADVATGEITYLGLLKNVDQFSISGDTLRLLSKAVAVLQFLKKQ